MRPIVSDDYAWLRIPGVGDCYYGYEVTTEEGEWCFRAQFDTGDTLTVPASDLDMRDQWDPVEGLMRGLYELGKRERIKAQTTRD